MFMYVLFAALLGLAAASPEVESFTNQPSPRVILDVADVAKVTYFYDMDFAYCGLYDQGPVEDTPELYFASISAKLYSVIRLQFDVTLYSMFQIAYIFKFTPFSFTPFKITIRFVRPEAVAFGGQPFDFNIKGSYSLTLLRYSVYTDTDFVFLDLLAWYDAASYFNYWVMGIRNDA